MSSISIDNASLVDGFKHNLPSIIKLYGQCFIVILKSSYCIVQNKRNNKVCFKGKRIDNVYIYKMN